MKRSSAPSQSGARKLSKFVPPVRQSNFEAGGDILETSLESFNNQQPLPNKDVPEVREIPILKDHVNVSIKNTAMTNRFRLPMIAKNATSMIQDQSDTAPDCKKKYYNVVWCKRSTKKHKNWEGDAILIVNGRSVSLLDTDGKEIGKGTGYKLQELSDLKEGETLAIGGKEVEILSTIKEEEFLSGKCFSNSSSSHTNETTSNSLKLLKDAKKPNMVGSSLFLNSDPTQRSITQQRELKPRFDPDVDDAVVLQRPPPSMLNSKTTVVDVVVDPHLSCHLRPHQKEGVDFLYQCIMGYKDIPGRGAILADEMGLGKTLQVITLIWTLLKQNPVGHKPVIKKALIVTPGSLVKNWVKEFKKWLGNERLNVFAVSSDKKAQDFKNTQVYPVMIVSYEMFVRYTDSIKETKFDLLVCDEGHRLKNGAIKTSTLLQSVTTDRRIVVTGTPIQNDLKEFYSLVDFCNPGILGSNASFRKVYEQPILSSKQPNCTTEEKMIGSERAKELSRLTKSFILRRTSEVNQQYLPSKTEFVIFCKASDQQVNAYRKLVNAQQLPALLNYTGDGSLHLLWINDLKKLCNHPSLVEEQKSQDKIDEDSDLYKLSPPNISSLLTACDVTEIKVEDSGKLMVLYDMLLQLQSLDSDDHTIREKMVIVSNYTKTLDLLEKVCKIAGHEFLRLDGSTSVNKRMDLVDKFNSCFSPQSIFLLSSKAGGVGLNLIGANRLILYDIDWNPANDLQAMARIWRDGQKKHVMIYRLLTAGSIEEKIYQRQISKLALGSNIVDTCGEGEAAFSKEDLRDLFTFRPEALSDTHDLMNCDCQGDAPANQKMTLSNRLSNKTPPATSIKEACSSQLSGWLHLSNQQLTESIIKDPLVVSARANISFVFASPDEN